MYHTYVCMYVGRWVCRKYVLCVYMVCIYAVCFKHELLVNVFVRHVCVCVCVCVCLGGGWCD
jgi:hypothetical protein